VKVTALRANVSRAAAVTFDITAAPRAVLRESVRFLYRVLGEERLGSARGNAWAAICANREGARRRADLHRLRANTRSR
jgi:hypothetical protein